MGYEHRILRVDLGSRSFAREKTHREVFRAFLGGRGMNAARFARAVDPSLDPFDPGTPLIIGAGLFTGLPVPGAGRFSVTTRSPEARTIADSSAGGFFGPALRRAGTDLLQIEGAAPSLSVLVVDPAGASFHEAEDLAGLDTVETQQRLRGRFGAESVVLCIGPAGERRVRFACAITDLKNAAARGGTGAVMGAKNLKAIVARGAAGIPVADPRRFSRLCLDAHRRMQATGAAETFGAVGSPWLFDIWNMMGAVRVRNGQASQCGDGLAAANFNALQPKKLACASCSIHCRRRNRLGGEGPDYSTLGSLGHLLGIHDAVAVTKLNNLCNRLGLDASSAGNILAWFFELAEKGLLDGHSADPRLRFGDARAVEELLVETANRRGIGDLIAESTRALSRLPAGSGRSLHAVKGLPGSDPVDLRFMTSFALGEAVSTRGADHLRSRPTPDVLGIDEEFARRVYKAEVDPDPMDYETKGVIVAYQEDFLALVDALGLCKFGYGLNSFYCATPEDFPPLLDAAFGEEFSESDLMEVGRNIVDTERLVNARLGVTAADDTLPERCFEEGMTGSNAPGRRHDREKFQSLVRKFYAVRGYGEDGLPARERRAEIARLLGLSGAAP